MATPAELARHRAGPRTPTEHIWFDRFAPERLQTWRRVQDPLADRCLVDIGLVVNRGF